MRATPLATRLAAGAAAGLANTFALQGLLAANQRFLPQATAPIRRDPGEHMVERATEALGPRAQARIPGPLEARAAQGLHLGYGMTFGLLYGLAGPRRRAGRILGGGAMLGLVTWAAGYLGWLPATGLMAPVTEQEPEQIAGPLITHILFGIGTALAYDQLRRWLDH